jgi:hypothetical protein
MGDGEQNNKGFTNILALVSFLLLFLYFWNTTRQNMHESISKDPKSSLEFGSIAFAMFNVIFKASCATIGIFIILLFLNEIINVAATPRISLIDLNEKLSKIDKEYDTQSLENQTNQTLKNRLDRREREDFAQDLPFIFWIIPKEFLVICAVFITCCVATFFVSLSGYFVMKSETFDEVQGHIFVDIIFALNLAVFIIALVVFLRKAGMSWMNV